MTTYDIIIIIVIVLSAIRKGILIFFLPFFYPNAK